MKKQNQAGSALVVVIIILVIALIGTLGFVVWQNFLQPKATIEKVQTDESSNISTRTLKDPEYINLTDWSVKLQAPDGLKASTVKYGKNRIAEAPEYYSFTTTKIVDLGEECATGYPFGDIVSLERSTSRQTALDNATSYGGELINDSAINNYFYYYQTSIANTTPVPSCAVSDTANSERSLLIELVKSLVAV
jgi:hypothetical protein